MPLPAAWSSTSASSLAAPSRSPSPSSTARSDTRNTAHMVYRMSSFRSRALSRFSSSAMVKILDLHPERTRGDSGEVAGHLPRGGLRGGDAGGDAYPVVGRARDRETWLFPDRRPDAPHPVQVADVVLRQRAAPAGYPVGDRRRRDPGRVREFGCGEAGQVPVLALQQGDLADAADGAPHDVRGRVPGQLRPL